METQQWAITKKHTQKANKQKVQCREKEKIGLRIFDVLPREINEIHCGARLKVLP